ncbi:NADPH:quinone oxidoreductase family protein [Aliiroseovarius sp. 2305UL8-7]|uniref:NADPH:quinone oxidoreductase family protein n=1 Tax=Aliiroseovarius conchicola TaxID=3121637 RepID=UPI003526D1BA
MTDHPKIMQCWVAEDAPGVANLKLTSRPVPCASPGRMIIKVVAAALNFSDILMINSAYQVRPPRPFVPGQEVAGVVVRVDEGSRWKVGDRITTKVYWGGFAEYAEVREDMAIPVPSGMQLQHAAALPVVYTTSMVALHHSVSVSEDDTVLVHAAAGGVGLAAVEIAHAAGATVIATASSHFKRELARKHGADHAINYTEADWKDRVKSLTNDNGATIIVDPVGGDVARQSMRCIARYGTLLIVGFASGDIAELPTNQLLLKSASATGVLWDHDKDPAMIASMTDRLTTLLIAGKINPVVNADYSLADLPRALNDLENRKTVGKIVLCL